MLERLCLVKKCCVMAEFSIVPVGTCETSVSRYVATVVESFLAIDGLEFEVTPMGTIFAADELGTILEAVRTAHEALAEMGAKRVASTLRIDDRRDKPRTMQDKVDAVKRQLKKT
jgi:uncharacterized protein (TIGR00106 family)